MDHEIFETKSSRPFIPMEAYRPIKRCPSCQSVYLTDDKCEACGRSLTFHPIGEPFGHKSVYGLKERYYEALPWAVKHFPWLENQNSEAAKSYAKSLMKRWEDLLLAVGDSSLIEEDQRRFFYVETLELTDELLRCGFGSSLLGLKIGQRSRELGEERAGHLLTYLHESERDMKANHLEDSLEKSFLGLKRGYLVTMALGMGVIVALTFFNWKFFLSLPIGR